MKEIKFDHFKNIEELIQHLEMWYAEDDYFAYDRYFHLDDARKMGMYIYKQHQEIERLHNIIKEVREYIEKNKQKIIPAYGDNFDDDFDIALDEEDIDNIIETLDKENKEYAR